MARKKRKPVMPPPDVPDETVPHAVDSTTEQSGDLRQLSDIEEADNESVRELVEEGQFFEAEVVSGVGNAPGPDAGPIRIRRRREDDVPPE